MRTKEAVRRPERSDSRGVVSDLAAARQLPVLSCGYLAAWITTARASSVSESCVDCILRREGRAKSPEMRLAAGKECRLLAK